MPLARTQTRRLPPAVVCVLVIGLALSIAQQFAIRDEVFVSGDGGIKTLVTKQFARGHWHADLRLPARPWVQELWQSGFYPFGPPFAYQREGRWFIQYPLPFMVVTAPFYAVLGFRGLTIVPLLGLWLLWLSMARILRRFDVSETGSAVSLGGLIFCSFVTPYGAMYWEHTLALGLSFFGFAVLVGKRVESGLAPSSFVGGGLLGLSVWFRPESIAFAAGVGLGLVVLRRPTRVLLGTAAGFGLMGLVFAGINLWLYGSPLGVHAVQQVDPLTDHVPHERAYEIAWYFVEQLFRYCPVIALSIAAAAASVPSAALRIDRPQAVLWAIVAASCVGTALLVPNNGGTQLGARYFLHALPPLFLLLGIAWDRAAQLTPGTRRWLRAAIAIGLAAGVYLNAVRGTRAIFLEYRHRALPALHAIREDPNRIVAVEHQWIAQDLEAAFQEKIFFRVRNQTELEQLSRALLERDQPRFTLVRYGGMRGDVIEATGLRLHLQPRGRFGAYVLVDCEVDRT